MKMRTTIILDNGDYEQKQKKRRRRRRMAMRMMIKIMTIIDNN